MAETKAKCSKSENCKKIRIVWKLSGISEVLKSFFAKLTKFSNSAMNNAILSNIAINLVI